MATHKLGFLQTLASCSVCLESVSDANERSIAKLICGHFFHLDCIGSAFNAKGSMQCPNCRHIENGQWLYANGCRQRDELILEDIINEEEYDVFAEVSEIRYPHDLMVSIRTNLFSCIVKGSGLSVLFMSFKVGMLFKLQQLSGEWCPYQGSYAQLSLSFGGIDSSSPATYGGLLVALVDEHTGEMEPGPFLQGHRGTHLQEERVQMQEMRNQHAYRGVPVQNNSSRSRRTSNTLAPIRARWSRSDHQNMGADPLQQTNRNNRGERNLAPPQPPIARQAPIARQQAPVTLQSAHYSERQLVSGAMRGSTSAVYNASREAEPSFSQPGAAPWRQEASSFGLTMPYPIEPEVQRWVPPPLSGLYGLHGLPTSTISSTHSSYRAPFQPFEPFTEDSDVGVFQHPFDNNSR